MKELINENIRKIHMIGALGCGMKGLGLLLSKMGYEVTGSDQKDHDKNKNLFKIETGHHANRISNQDLVIYSSAVKAENVELQEAKKKGLPLLSRPQALALIMNRKSSIAISGVHGKTTTTGMLGQILIHAGFDPTIMVGGRLSDKISYCYYGKSHWNVYEADESDGSLNFYHPKLLSITNIEFEHVDYYKNIDHMLKAFLNLIEQTQDKVFIFGDDILNHQIKIPSHKKIVFGFDSHYDFHVRIKDISKNGSNFDVYHQNNKLDQFFIPVVGRYQILNALNAISIASYLDVPAAIIKESLCEFQGMDRRFQLVGQFKGMDIISDYAHHPREIQACFEAVQQKYTGHKIAVFEPHRYSRFKLFYCEFADQLVQFDAVFVTEIFASSEQNNTEISSELIIDEMKRRGLQNVFAWVSDRHTEERIREYIDPEGVIVFMGAGAIHHKALDFVSKTPVFV